MKKIENRVDYNNNEFKNYEKQMHEEIIRVEDIAKD